MTQWEYITITIRIVQTRGKMAGYFTRHEFQRGIDPESEAEMTELGRDGWELVSVVPLSSAATPVDAARAAAFFKRALLESPASR